MADNTTARGLYADLFISMAKLIAHLSFLQSFPIFVL